MAPPQTQSEQYQFAMTQAWAAAERADRLLNNNNGSAAMGWAASAQAWASIAQAVGPFGA